MNTLLKSMNHSSMIPALVPALSLSSLNGWPHGKFLMISKMGMTGKEGSRWMLQYNPTYSDPEKQW